MMDRIFSSSVTEPNSGCWLWLLHVNHKGYGILNLDGRSQRAHRVSWAAANGRAVPDGMLVCHHCDVPSCVNPQHLFIGDYSANTLDSVSKGRHFVANHPEHNGRRKLSDQQIAFVREHATPSHPEYSYSALGRMFGVGPIAIARAARGETFPIPNISSPNGVRRQGQHASLRRPRPRTPQARGGLNHGR